MLLDQNGKRVSRDIRREPDETYSSRVWVGAGTPGNPARNIRRMSGYLTREAAVAADISETVAQTNMRICGRSR